MRYPKRLLLRSVAIVSLLMVPAPAGSASLSNEDYTESPLAAIYSKNPDNGEPDAQIAKNGEAVGVQVVGYHDLGGGGFNADVWVHENYAYVGQWGFGASHPRYCDPPERRGVKVVDISDPASPKLVARLNNPPSTTAEDVQVIRYTSGPAAGKDIAMVGIQACFRLDASLKRGLQLFDVTTPSSPKELGFLSTGMAARGVHEFWAFKRGTRVYALLIVSFSDTRDLSKRGDVRVADITDPANPVEIGNWGLKNVFPASQVAAIQNSGQGCFRFRFGHGADASADGTTAYISYWDWGIKILNITNPAAPTLVGTTTYQPDEDGDSHSSYLANGGKLMLGADEDLPPPGNCKAPAQHREKGWGYLRIFDISKPAAPTQVGEYRTPNSMQASRNRKGDYTIHNPVVVGSRAYLSWYTDGLRVLDIGNPRAPSEIARFVPPASKDPQHVLPYAPEVWGVVVNDGLIALSDMNSGLWLVRTTK
jgi:hypothetical protein